MSSIIIPKGYTSPLDLYSTQKAITLIKRIFEDNLSGAMNLQRVSAPLFVIEATGLNDNLCNVERAVSFDIPAVDCEAQIVHSLAKWKRLALAKYGFSEGRGLYTDMNAIRRDEELDNIHSVYVDQWDWEKIISEGDRTLDFLKQTVKTIVGAICRTQLTMMHMYPGLRFPLREEVTFISSEELLRRYPDKTPKERELYAAAEYKTVFITQIGGKLSDGTMHDGRAPDYDDWSMNGDLIFYNEILGIPFEVSSMGIRVDKKNLRTQLAERGCSDWEGKMFHRMLLEDKLPLTIGGGIGQSRLCMLLLNKAHIGEVQSSVWDEGTIKACAEAGIELL